MRRLWTLVLPLVGVAAFAQPPTDYATQVAPVFAKKCKGCHGAAQQMAGLRVDDVAAMTERKVILPGKAAESTLVQRITSEKAGFRMPPGRIVRCRKCAARPVDADLRARYAAGGYHAGANNAASRAVSVRARGAAGRNATPYNVPRSAVMAAFGMF